MSPRGNLVALAILAVLVTPGCMAYRGPRELRVALEAHAGDRVERELGLSMGRVTTSIAAGFLHAEGDEDLSLAGVKGIKFAVYDLSSAGASRPLDLSRLQKGDWETLARVRSADDDLLIQARADGDILREVVLVAADPEEVVYVRLHGRLDRTIEKLLVDSFAKKTRDPSR